MREGYFAEKGQGKPDSDLPEHMTVEQAATWWARRSRTPKPHRATLVRWATRGCRGHRLHAECVGGRWYVSEAALRDFHRLLNQPQPMAVDRSAGPVRAADVSAAITEIDRLLGRPTGDAA